MTHLWTGTTCCRAMRFVRHSRCIWRCYIMHLKLRDTSPTLPKRRNAWLKPWKHGSLDLVPSYLEYGLQNLVAVVGVVGDLVL